MLSFIFIFYQSIVYQILDFHMGMVLLLYAFETYTQLKILLFEKY